MCNSQDCRCVLPVDYGKTLAAHLLHADFVILLRCSDEPGCWAYLGIVVFDQIGKQRVQESEKRRDRRRRSEKKKSQEKEDEGA